MKKLIFYFSLWLAAISCQPKGPAIISAIIKPAHYTDYELYWYDGKTFIPIKTDSTKTHFTIEITADTLNFIQIKGEFRTDDDKWIYSYPLYVSPGRKIELEIDLGDRLKSTALLSDDQDNLAINAYDTYHNEQLSLLWNNTPAPDQAESFLNNFQQQAKTILETYQLTEDAKNYIIIGTYVNTLEFIEWLDYLYAKTGKNMLPPNLTDKLPQPDKILNNAIALQFISSTSYIYNWLRKNSKDVEGQIQLLRENFTDPAIREAMTYSILQSYVSNYKYSSDFDKDIKHLSEMASQLPDKGEALLREFNNKKNTLPNSPMPDALLEDINGKIISFSDLKGKNLYVDFWASWCGPCCAEVPYLHQLEKQVRNPEVEFISISLDTNKKAWKKKMEKLKMSGKQYIVVGTELTDALNIRGIPHFMIYDKTGRLHTYNALPPSAGESLKQKLEQMK